MPHIFVKKGFKLDSELYVDILYSYLKPWIESNCDYEKEFIFQQDGAPCHTSKFSQNWLRKNIWPHSSPDPNALDFSIGVNVESMAYNSSMPSLYYFKGEVTGMG